MRKVAICALLGAALAAGPVSAIDPWDAASEDDNSVGTDNGLTHGSEQIHDLDAEATADEDWYTFTNASRSSYEVLIDGTTGDLNLEPGDVARMGSAVDVIQNSVGLAGFSMALRWQNTTASSTSEFIRVSGAACNTTCTALDTYRIRMYETTYAVPRFNNSGTQVTVLMVSNAATFNCNAQYNFYDPTGVFLGSSSNAFSPRETHVLNTSALLFAMNQSGSIYVSHTCGYGGLAGKAVALEPSTGFAFDTPMTARPR